ncbi:MAG: nucleotide exchange factor GrpE [Halapricum sp.]
MSEQDGTSEADEQEETTEEQAQPEPSEGGEEQLDNGSIEESTEAGVADKAESAPESEDEPREDEDTEPTEEDVESEADELGVADEVLEYVESVDPEEIADEIATLRFEVETLESDVAKYEEEVEDLRSRLKRKQADFENYKKRMEKRREQEKARATEDLVTRLLDVRDNLQRAVEQDEDTDIRDGVESTLDQFDRVLEQENVTAIEPEPGDDVDPERHEVLVRMDSDQPAGKIAQVHRPGYEMAGKVIRTAQVAVSEDDE